MSQSKPNIYGQYSLSFNPTIEEVEQFIATMQASDRIENNPHAWEVLIEAYPQEE